MKKILIIITSAILISGCGGSTNKVNVEAVKNPVATPTPTPDVNTPLPLFQVTIQWDKPTTNEDGTPLVNIDGYEILYGKTSEKYDHSINIDNENTLTAVISGLDAGEYFFSMMTRTTEKNKSSYATESSLWVGQ
jgi:hypothetical protein